MSADKAYPEMRELADGIEKIFASAVCSGIVGDKRHTRGYHRGRRFVVPDDYSVVRPDDRTGRGPDDGAAGIDITMSRRDMITATARLGAAFRDADDPRRKYLNAANGWDGDGPAVRLDFYARRRSEASPDHRWHLHLEKRRRYIRARVANAAILSILRGDTVREWLTERGVEPAAAPGRRTMKPPPYPGRILRRNDRQTHPDPAVRQWQQRMRERGWTSIGKADGLPGEKFGRVVKAWQRTIGVKPDGLVGPKTWPTPWTRPLSGG